MIWNDKPARSDPRKALARHVSDEIRAACGDSALNPALVQDVAHAVATFWGEHPERDVPTDFLGYLIVRALLGLNEEEAAFRVARTFFPDDGAVGVLRSAFPFRDSSPVLWHLCASKLLRHTTWTVGGERDVWVLDLSRLRRDQESGLEIVLYPAIRAVLNALAGVWDRTDGQGVLGLRGLAEFAGRRSKEVQRYCRDCAGLMRARQGWAHTPEILNLDAG